MRVTSAEFLQSSPGLEACPADDVPEFAFIGRSNAGKSSLLNLLTGKQGLARVSQTPGCTQLINFFKINGAFRMVDLPGYGYAKVPKGHRAAFQDIIAGYIADRPNLRRVFVLVDSRHEPQTIDLEFLEWLGEV
ncbi:MAG: ribosome biogenesis GTP-binding protein YihA/YsxC, partial [Spartobacteria bacterium]